MSNHEYAEMYTGITTKQCIEISKIVYPQKYYHTAYNGRLFLEDNFKNGHCTHGVFCTLKVYEYLKTIKTTKS